MIGALVVLFALLFYSIGFAKIQRKRVVNSRVLLFFTLGVVLDISATILMILGSSNGLLTFHGMLGYSALLGMSIDAFLLWKHNLKQGADAKVDQRLNIYSRVAYSWWVVAFITGGLLVAMSHMK